MELIRNKTKGNSVVKEVRGMGLMIGVELDIPGRPVVERMFELGVLSNVAGGNVLRIVPLIISQEEIDRSVEILAQALS